MKAHLRWLLKYSEVGFKEAREWRRFQGHLGIPAVRAEDEAWIKYGSDAPGSFCWSSALCSLTVHTQALTNTPPRSPIGGETDGAARPAQQTAVEWIYIRSLHFLLLSWSQKNSRESVEPINTLWSINPPHASFNVWIFSMSACAWSFFFFLHFFICIAFLAADEVQRLLGGLVRAFSGRFDERKGEDGSCSIPQNATSPRERSRCHVTS